MMKKRKLNWVDYTVIVLVAVLCLAACWYFLIYQKQAANTPPTRYTVVLDTKRIEKGLYTDLVQGEEFSVVNGGYFGTLAKDAQIVPFEASVFDETTKKYNLVPSEDYCYYRLTFEVEATRDEYQQVIAGGYPLIIEQDFILESVSHRLNLTVRSVTEVTAS